VEEVEAHGRPVSLDPDHFLHSLDCHLPIDLQ
jgi:hypothetical protein